MEFRGYTLLEAEERILAKCIGRVFRQVVWDLNAVYMVATGGDSVKIEVLADAPPPEMAAAEYDEVVFVRVDSLNRPPEFNAGGEEGFWYKVLGENTSIIAVDVARTAVQFPGGVTFLPTEVSAGHRHVLADAGVVLTLPGGSILPAVSLFNSFGFATWPEPRLYDRVEVDQHLKGKYSLRRVAAIVATKRRKIL